MVRMREVTDTLSLQNPNYSVQLETTTYTVTMASNNFFFSIDTLLEDHLIRAEVETYFREDFPFLLEKFKNGDKEAYNTLDAYFHDAILDGSEIAEILEGEGSYGTFSISILKYGSATFFINAPDFDPIGTFDTLEEAISYAEMNYSGYL